MKLLVFLLLFSTLFTSRMYAQAADAGTLHETAKAFLKTGDYDNAILVLNRAIPMDPANKDMQKDLLYASYLKRDFAKAREVGETLMKDGKADVPTYQMLGLTYKAIAEFKEAEKMYKNGIKRFPNEGVLYSEYGEMQMEKNPDEAIRLFEKGLEADVNYSGNYFHVAKAYAGKGEIIWSIIYAETFLNLESFTARSTEMKNILLEQYKMFFSRSAEKTFSEQKKNEFIKTVAGTLSEQQSQASYGITPETLTAIRTRFILQWFDKSANQFPFRLFEHQRQLLQEGFFEAYNQWMFGPAFNLASYQLWQKYHTEDYDSYMAFARGRVYRIPEGQQYGVF